MKNESSAVEPVDTVLSSLSAKKTEQTQPDVMGIPAVLVWALGCLASLMLLCAAGFCLYSYRAELPTAAKAVSLLLLPLIFWGAYVLAAKKGHRSTEVVALLTCMSWAVILLTVQTCVYELQPWFCGFIFVAGLVVLPIVHPWRSGIVALGIGSLFELALLALSSATGQMSYATLWLCSLTLLMLWTLGGCWCMLTNRSGYRRYGVIAVATFSVFLVMYCTLATFPQFLFLDNNTGYSTGVWRGAVLLWLLPMLLSLPLHVRFARRNNRAAYTAASLCLWLSAAISVPLLMVVNLPFLSAPAALVFSLSLIYYGAVYKFNWPLLAGCITFFISVISILLRLGIHPIGSAVVLILLSGVTFYITLRLNARRRVLLAAMKRVQRKRRAEALASKPDVESVPIQKVAEQPSEQQKA